MSVEIYYRTFTLRMCVGYKCVKSIPYKPALYFPVLIS
jgi:hypothetical protein